MSPLAKLFARSYALAALVGVLFLGAQTIVLVHDLDSDSYDTEHSCYVCAAASVLGSSNVAAAPELPIILADRSLEPAADASFVAPSVRRATARAPPAVS